MNQTELNLKNRMDNFNLDELMDLAEAYVGPMVDAIYCRLMDRDLALEDPEVVMLLTEDPFYGSLLHSKLGKYSFRTEGAG